MKQFFGKYRGTVTSNLDPLQRGRILATVPDVLGQHATGWALPCLPYAGNGVGLFFVPPIGALVWIEFERGDSDYPIWSGCIPDGVSVGSPNQKTIKTHSATIIIDDTPGASFLSLETSSGQKIKLHPTGIEIDNGKGATIKLSGPTVSINGQALEIT